MKHIIVLFLMAISLCYGEYSKSSSIEYSYIAAITHCPSSQVQSWKCSLCNKINGLTDVTYIQNKITKIVGFIGYQPTSNRILISWRCTVDIMNYFEDFNFETMPFPCRGCEIHVGFYQSYKSVEEQVKKKVETLMAKYPTAMIHSIGHSLGGALSIITGIELQLKYAKVAEVHNFGTPRIGNANLAQFIKLKIPIVYRIVHDRDLAPHLPFEQTLGEQYRHMPYQVLYDEQFNNYQVCDDSGEDKTCSNKFFPNYKPSQHHVYFIPMEC